ncbi:MAG: hypothetical protein N3F03_05630 [Ignavibacteria bacterium]|nr:hypothetical protein [Ignavibacteria bacterium]
MNQEKEFKVKLVGNSLLLDDEDLEFLKSTGYNTFKVKIILDLDEICKRENISKKTVEQVANTQKIPTEVALGLLKSTGKIKK